MTVAPRAGGCRQAPPPVALEAPVTRQTRPSQSITRPPRRRSDWSCPRLLLRRRRPGPDQLALLVDHSGSRPQHADSAAVQDDPGALVDAEKAHVTVGEARDQAERLFDVGVATG